MRAAPLTPAVALHQHNLDFQLLFMVLVPDSTKGVIRGQLGRAAEDLQQGWEHSFNNTVWRAFVPGIDVSVL